MKSANNRFIPAIVAVFLALAALPAPWPAPAGAAESPGLLPAGEAAPDFQTVDLEGKPFTFSEEIARGPVFLVFWSIF